ncbi:MAG TPA: isochorismatase family cysteine hydrolase [Acidobacteriaceae bacterium]|jgi:nicotinamidase-related amidase|nr:isochorismatase family cysteine hydrolase [Acidobacteriaceae bacterium]
MPDTHRLSIPTKLADICRPARTALILYDMQAGVVSQIDSGKAVTERCAALLKAARTAGFPIYFTRHRWLPNRLAGVGQMRRSMIWHRTDDPWSVSPPFSPGSTAWEIVPELAPTEEECVIDKITMSAFEGTFLDIALRDAKLESFMIGGIALEVGIGPTVRQALDLNYIPIVVSDATGARTEEQKERVLTEFADTGEVVVVDTETLLPLLTSG